LEILILLLLMVLNGIFSMSEMAVIFARKARLKHWAGEGDRGARKALELAENPQRFLSTIQVGITLIGILAGAFGGTTVARSLEAHLKEIPLLASYSNLLAVGTVVAVLTFFSIVIGELVPKRMALSNAERVASLTARPMHGLARIARPLVWILTVSSELILKVLGYKPSQEPSITEEEIKILIEQGTRDGVFHEAEKEIVKSVFRLADREVEALMTPRLEIVWLNHQAPEEENREKILRTGFSRFPVVEGGLDNVLGVVRARDLLGQALSGKPMDLKEVMSPPLFIPENASVLHLLELFKRSRPHLALVVDEYGGIQGLVTLNDILESIVGEIASQDPYQEPTAVRREDGSWLVDGMIPIDEFKELFQIRELPEEDSGHFQTLGGFVMMQMGRVPNTADHFEWEGLRFEVADMDGKRVDKVLISRLPDAAEGNDTP
jgi:putative hemolysin